MRVRVRMSRSLLVDVSTIQSKTRTQNVQLNVISANGSNIGALNASITVPPTSSVIPHTQDVTQISEPSLFQHIRSGTPHSGFSKQSPDTLDTRLKAVHQLENLIAYSFAKKQYAWEALQTTHPGHPNGNRSLALLGDSVIDYHIIRRWYHTGRSLGYARRLLTLIGKNDNLTAQGKAVGLDKMIIINPPQRYAVTDAQIADTVEAVIGAVSVDGGHIHLKRVFQRLGLDI